MKEQHIKVDTKSPNKLPGIVAAIITALITCIVPPKVWCIDLFWTGNAANPAIAGSGTWATPEYREVKSWSSTSTSETAASWVDGSVAHFLGSVGGTATLDSDITAGGISFDLGANAFTINTHGYMLAIEGAGIVNNSGKTQTITNNGSLPSEYPTPAGSTVFSDTSSAGRTTITNNGTIGVDGGLTEFKNASTAGSATITNDGGMGPAVSASGSTLFFNSSSAGSATITNNGGTGPAASPGGSTEFLDTSTAGSATITNNGGVTAFLDSSTAASATITNSGGTGSTGSVVGLTDFFNTSTAGNATIINNGGASRAASGGSTVFFDTSTGGNATITNNGGTSRAASGGSTAFFDTSTAGNATIINNGGASRAAFGGSTVFFTTSSAGNATIINNGGTAGGLGGTTRFVASSDGGTARAITNGNGSLDISGLTTAGMGTGSIEGSGNYFLGSKTLSVGGNNLSTTVSGVIQDGGTEGGAGGSLTKVGTGTLTLIGVNTYSGSTKVEDGILAVNTDVNLGTGQLTFDGGTLQVLAAEGGIASSKAITLNPGGGAFLADPGTNSTLSGVISGTGSIVKLGGGTLTLTGINTYTGTTTVNAGSLIVDGSIASAQTLVNAGGLLGGNGSLGKIGGSLVNGGIVSPGTSIGTLTVIGNYTQNAGGTLRIEVASVTEHDLLAVNGHASLGGTLQLIGLSGFKLHVGEQVTFLTANGGVSGSFGTVQSEFATGTIVKADVVNLPNAVLLEGTQGSFVQGACTPNTVSVAQALDSAVGDPRASTLIGFLNDQPLNQLCSDFGLISPEALASIFNIGVSLANVQTANLKRRLEDVRAGSNGFSSAGFTWNGSAPSFSGGLAGVSGPEGKSGPSVMAPIPENRWGVWVTGIGEFTNVDSTNEAPGYYLQTGGLSLGVDYRVSSNFAIGLTAGYAHTGADLANGGNLEVNGGKLGLYATAFGSGFYADAAVTGGLSGYDTHRTALLGSANGSTNGGDLNVLIAGGYDWKKGDLSIGPTANFQYTYVGFGGFTESGSLAPLKFDNQNAESERTAFGMKASYDWKVGHIIIRPEISAAWQHEYGDQAYSIVSSFASGAGNSFSVNSPQIGRDSMLIGAGAAVLLSERISVYAYYDGELFRTNYQSNNVSAGVRMTF